MGCNKVLKKSCTRETLNLSGCADSSTEMFLLSKKVVGQILFVGPKQKKNLPVTDNPTYGLNQTRG